MEGKGQYILNVNCSNADAGDVFAIRGLINDTDNVAGGWNGTISDDARYDVGQIDDTITGNTIILDIPNTAEFEARSIVSDDYVVVGDTLARVTLVDQTTLNDDMVGTDGANTTVHYFAGTAAGLHSTTDTLIGNRTLDTADYFLFGSDAVANVTLVNTTTNNSDMRGTNSALLAGDINLSAGVVESNLLQMNGVTTPVDNLVTFTTSMLDLVNNWVLCDIKALDGDAIQQTDGKVHSIPVGL
jgi:hypothetical protein